MYDQAVDYCLAELKFILYLFVTSNKIGNSLRANNDILVYNKYFDKIIFIANQKHIIVVDLDKINLDNDNNFDLNDRDDIIHYSCQNSRLAG